MIIIIIIIIIIITTTIIPYNSYFSCRNAIHFEKVKYVFKNNFDFIPPKLLSCRNQLNDLLRKSIDWLLYNGSRAVKCVKKLINKAPSETT